jgi:putative flippase GtrA
MNRPQSAGLEGWQHWIGEGARYAAASAAALCADFAVYWSLIHLAGVHYLVAAPAGFTVGLAAVYSLCVLWVFTRRRFSDRRAEFALFAAIGVGGMALNQLVIYAAVEQLLFSYEHAKLLSAAVVFSFNFTLRKLLLFTRG